MIPLKLNIYITKKIVIIGGGITSIFSALYLHKKRKLSKTQIILIESSKNIGGNLRGFNYEETYLIRGHIFFKRRVILK